MFYVYVDYRLDTSEPFYVGIGNENRIKDFIPSHRNLHHGRTWKKYLCLRFAVPFSSDWNLCCGEEKRLIKALKTRDIINEHGCNLTEGGDGAKGCRGNLGKKKPPRSKEHLANLSKARRLRPSITEETRKKIAMTSKGRKFSAETIAKRIATRKTNFLKKQNTDGNTSKQNC